jgi:multidrug efflux system membrane fusion protein
LSCLIVLAICVSGGCRRGESAEGGQPAGEVIAVTVQAVRTGTIRDVVRAGGMVVPSTIADFLVTAHEPAEIVELTRNEGDKVQAGDVLVKLEIASITNQIATAQLELSDVSLKYEAAKANEEKLNKMFSQGFAARNQWESARSALSQAETAVNQARAKLDSAKALEGSTVVRAKFPGVIVKKFHSQGELVAGGENDPIMRVVDPTKIQVALQVPIDQAERIQQGQAATVQADIATEMATVAMKSAPAGAAAATVEVRLAFTAATTIALDAIVQAEIVVEERPNVLLVPGGAVQRPEDGPPFVWVATDNSQAAKREVRVGLSSNGQTQILSGVAAGDEIIVTGLSQLTEGAAVSISR